MEFRKAYKSEIPEVWNAYLDICENTKEIKRFAKWRRNIYPPYERVEDAVEKEEMYVLREGENTVGAAVISLDGDESCHDANWQLPLSDKEYGVIHMFGVTPEYQRRGVGSILLRECVNTIREAGMKAVRLDALGSNIPAHSLYMSHGFKMVDKRMWSADKIGKTEFLIFEMIL